MRRRAVSQRHTLHLSEPPMIKIETHVSYDGGKGIVDRTSIKVGVKLYRVNDKWMTKEALTLQ